MARDLKARVDELLARNTELLFEQRDNRSKIARLESALREQGIRASIYDSELAQLLAESLGYPTRADNDTKRDLGEETLLTLVIKACMRLQTEGAHA